MERDLPWATIIRGEMETWVPERLPEHFRPRVRRPGTPLLRAAREVRRPLAIAIAVVAAGCLAYSHLPTRTVIVPGAVETLLGSHVTATPATTPAVTTWPAHRAPIVTTAPVRHPKTVPAQPAAVTQPAQPASAPPPSDAQNPVPTPAPAQPTAAPATPTPGPTPTPGRTCVLLICVVH